MTAIICISVLFGLSAVMVYFSIMQPMEKKLTKGNFNVLPLFILFALAFIARIAGAMMYRGHETDMNCFDAWSGMVFENGFSNFYTSESFTDYPPGYMYILYLIGAVKSLFGLSGEGVTILLKLPAIIFDLLTGVLIYRIAAKNTSKNLSVYITAFYLFNPAVFMNSAVWGQVDAVYTFLLILMTYLASEKKLIPSYFVFALAVFVKPQAFIFTPILLFAFIEQLIFEKENRKYILKHILFGLLAIASIIVLSLPFGLKEVWNQYIDTLNSYPYLTINAFNLWGALKQNWVPLTGFTTVLGYLILAGIVIASAYLFFKSKNKSKYFFLGAFLCLATYMLSTKMHDRYSFAAMAMLICAYAAAPSLHTMLLYTTNMLMQFFNVAWVLFIYETNINLYAYSPTVIVASLINIVIFGYMIYTIKAVYFQTPAVLKKPVSAEKLPQTAAKRVSFTRTRPKLAFTKADWIALTAITLVYSCIALYNLGDNQAPQSIMDITEDQVILDLGHEQTISKLMFYQGPAELSDARKLTISYLDAAKTPIYTETLNSGSVFYWNTPALQKETAQYISLSSNGDRFYIMELALYNSNNELITPLNASDYSVLFDEQDTIPEIVSYKNSTYFDEVYHARTAYEFIHHLPVYEWTHPPLGKIIISLGIRLFGMTPFGWRIAGTFFGILMIPVIYCAAKLVTRRTWASIFTCILFTFDFMHFVQTRIATIDVYGTFFIMLMYLFMYKYYTMSFYDTPLKKTLLPLFFCGLATGLGIASKWTAVYATVGLAVIFLLVIYKRYKEYLWAKENPKGESDGISHAYVISNFTPFLIKTVLWCCLFFIVIPLTIYALSYIPYINCEGSDGWRTIFTNQTSMYYYHAKTVVADTHPYSSKWFSWPVMYKPVFYFDLTLPNGLKEGISAFGNPLLWWVGIPALFYMAYLFIAKKDKTALFLLLGYLASLVPWIPVARTTFMYHYFPCVPFIALMLGHSVNVLYVRGGQKKTMIYATFIYAGVAVLLFGMFYPVLTGTPVSGEYVSNWLRWFNSWVLVR